MLMFERCVKGHVTHPDLHVCCYNMMSSCLALGMHHQASMVSTSTLQRNAVVVDAA